MLTCTILMHVFQFQFGAIKSVVLNVGENHFSYFNSNLVRLKAQKPQPPAKQILYFNSNLVRLKEISGSFFSNSVPHFNSNLVRLKVAIWLSSPAKQVNFNSNLVRLKELNLIHLCDADYIFQFQFGAIKSFFQPVRSAFLTSFQFQFGAIKSILPG